MTKSQAVAVKVIIQNDNKFLALKRSDNDDITPGNWELPGGRLHWGENPVDGLIREVKEETSLHITKIQILSSWDFIPSTDLHLIGITFTAISDSAVVEIDEEHTEFRWIKFSDECFEIFQKEIICDLMKVFE